MNEHQARDHVKKLRRFYTDALIYAVVNLGLILIWAIAGGGYFWPIWVIVGWGIGLGVHAFSLGLIPQVNSVVPFMTPKWEEEEVRRLMAKEKEPKKSEEKEEGVMTDKIKSVASKKTSSKKTSLKTEHKPKA
ncbi:MAG: 2TM domain-containing protein [Alphaproteobacteria bacterium]|nr:2TM domain-containing protein [Alphaproteobacteria bacterium]